MLGGKDNKPKPIAEKYSLDYYRRPLVTRIWKNWWNYTALALAIAIVGVVYLAQRNEAFHAAPVSSVHSTFGQRCERCHDASWQTARRLVALNTSDPSVFDNACQACHQAADHVSGLVSASACATCHQEHRPERELTAVADSNCTQCHRQLEMDGDTAVSFTSRIRQFAAGDAAHPEFALLRSSEGEIGPRHAARAVARFVAAGQGGGKWMDRGGLNFNHRVHLDPSGVMQPDRKKRVLTCSACHVPEADGQYMQPIAYERHCARCHPLRLTGPLSWLGEIPHGSVDEVRGFLRRAKLNQLRQESLQDASAAAAKPAGPRGATMPRLPSLPIPALLSDADEQKIDALIAAADHAVFGLEAKGMCRHCHHVEARNGDWQVLIEDPQFSYDDPAGAGKNQQTVPERWFQHARFDHQSHRAIECGDCHAAAGSSAAADVLLPSIAVCRSCHGTAAQSASSRIRDDCVLCHSYHDESRDSHGVPLQQLFTDTHSESASPTMP